MKILKLGEHYTPLLFSQFKRNLEQSLRLILAIQITPSIPTQYASKVNNLQSIGAIVLVLALKKRLTNHYWFNLPANAGFPFLALVEHTNFVSPSCFGGEHIIYCGQYLETNHRNFLMTPEEITRQYLPALTRFNQNFDENI